MKRTIIFLCLTVTCYINCLLLKKNHTWNLRKVVLKAFYKRSLCVYPFPSMWNSIFSMLQLLDDITGFQPLSWSKVSRDSLPSGIFCPIKKAKIRLKRSSVFGLCDGVLVVGERLQEWLPRKAARSFPRSKLDPPQAKAQPISVIVASLQ